MRLHRLRVTAFQAFAGTEQVDFDALGAAGLFLFHGDTGAGKTTLLDAVCFALYGEVPGARARDARLRSDHAAADVRTEVELEVTLRDRRFRIVRRPKQERPKLRGDGVTEEGHACTVQELRDGEWTTLAARPEEARSELADPLGMSVDQFCQVVLLPQGEFAAFLRAGSDDRRVLLERLFGTERFAQVEWWLRDRARMARGELYDQLGTVRDVVSRLSQAADEPAPEQWELDPASVREWAGGLNVTAQANAVTAQEAAVGARSARASAERALTEATELAERRTRHATAAAELESWRSRQTTRDDAERELLSARAAAPIAPLLAAAEARAIEAEEAQQAADEAWNRLDEEARAAALQGERASEAAARAPEPEDRRITAVEQQQTVVPPEEPTLFDPPAAPTLFDAPLFGAEPASEPQPDPPVAPAAAPLRAHAAELRTRAGALGALVAVEERLEQDERSLTELLGQADAATARAATATQALADAEQERVRLDGVAQSARRAADRLEALAAEASTAQERAERAADRDRLSAAQTSFDDRVRAAVDAEQSARTVWLDLRERRLAGMAAELAANLAPGEPCTVCGSTEHPAPAHLATDITTAAADEPSAIDRAAAAKAARPPDIPLAEREETAQEAHAACAEERAALEREAAANATALAAARAVAGDASAEELRGLAAQLAEQVTGVRAEAGGLAGAERALRALATATAAHEQQRRDAEQVAAAARSAHAERSTALDADRTRVRDARGGAATIAQRIETLHARTDAAEHAAVALERAARATAARAEAHAAAATAAINAGFAPSDEELLAAARARIAIERAAAAVRDATALAQLEQRLRAYDEGVASRTALVQDPTLKAAAAADAPDLPALTAAARQVAAQDEASQGRHTVQQRRLAEVTSLTGALDDALTALAPVAERERTIRELAALVDGGSAANRLRMRLSAYVLAARLEEVAAAATIRLERMSNGRYALIHADDGARGRRRGGLDLRIVDGWTGRERPPSTLSGGETFLASLALALGLADVVAADAGGSRLETLFIDEGFGSLDERTLDEVLDVLDTLREGGRAVGIVSHVAELRQRVPAKLHVIKGRNGSHVEQSAGTPAG
ncbi:AAA family ATPase [Conexibacter sp. CPCC 206217]|uniref:AAA family ATPase n=1 Tax=Conexibacter sp. CPCC 206217 TaxID=3064574 RepID=UPI0027256494|nr:AAA family ATPase [Conexibacter sp. CPCC 206217]MDO8210885.1 AAA family ATPase [Conexibacter sp. CPCC 206217]